MYDFLHILLPNLKQKSFHVDILLDVKALSIYQYLPISSNLTKIVVIEGAQYVSFFKDKEKMRKQKSKKKRAFQITLYLNPLSTRYCCKIINELSTKILQSSLPKAKSVLHKNEATDEKKGQMALYIVVILGFEKFLRFNPIQLLHSFIIYAMTQLNKVQEYNGKKYDILLLTKK